MLADKVPLGRVGAASELGTVALFLASSDASYVTGAKKPYALHHALQDPRHITDHCSALLGPDDKERRSNSNQHMGPYSGTF